MVQNVLDNIPFSVRKDLIPDNLKWYVHVLKLADIQQIFFKWYRPPNSNSDLLGE